MQNNKRLKSKKHEVCKQKFKQSFIVIKHENVNTKGIEIVMK
jgi:hypothetical protein